MNTWSWIAWLSASLVFISLTRNPLYLILLLMELMIVFMVWNESTEAGSVVVVSPVRFSLLIIVLATLFNVLTSHFGDTVLLTIPGRIPLLSGPVTFEAMLYGFSTGLILSAMLAAFTIVNIVLPFSALIRLVPRAFYPLSIVVSIAITFLPSTRRQIELIREAQAIRGHRLTGLRDWLPLFLPLLVGGLESSMQLAETMTARGFASSKKPLSAQNRMFLFSGLLLAMVSWIASQSARFHDDGLLALICGIILIGVAIWRAGRGMPRVSYKKERWAGRDYLMVLACGALILLLLVAPAAIPKAILFYQPYPKATLPSFDLRIGLLTLTLLLPVFLKHEQQP